MSEEKSQCQCHAEVDAMLAPTMDDEQLRIMKATLKTVQLYGLDQAWARYRYERAKTDLQQTFAALHRSPTAKSPTPSPKIYTNDCSDITLEGVSPELVLDLLAMFATSFSAASQADDVARSLWESTHPKMKLSSFLADEATDQPDAKRLKQWLATRSVGRIADESPAKYARWTALQNHLIAALR